MKILYTDIDLVLSLLSEVNPKPSKWGLLYRFNDKAVKVYNEILIKTGAEIVVSSDWRDRYSLKELQEIFVEWAGIIKPPIDVTPFMPMTIFQKLASCRAQEILSHVSIHKPESWVAIDDLYLIPYLEDNHFVYLPRANEGIKQSSKKDEVIRKLNKVI